MKKIILAALVSGVMSTPVLAADSAGDGTVTFEGSIIVAACGIAPESVDQTVNLGQVTTKQLAGGGTSRPVPFTIELVDCEMVDTTVDPTAKNMAKVTFTGGVSQEVPDTLAIQGSAAGAGVVIVGLNGQPVTIDGSSSTDINFQNGDNSLLFTAYLQGAATGTATPGAFTALANFTMSYE